MANHYNKKTLVQILQKTAAALGRQPEPGDMIEPPADVFIAYFKKWDKALKKAGLMNSKAAATASMVPEISGSQAEAVKTDFENKARVASKTLVGKEVTASLKTSAGEENKTTAGRHRYSKSIITKMLLDEVNRLGKKPTRKEIDANKNLPTVSTCLNYFGTTRIGDIWKEILDN